MTFINCTHHPAHRWRADQRKAAQAYGGIIELPFPSVAPSFDSDTIHKLACDLLDRFREIAERDASGEHDGKAAVHLMGEWTLCGAVMREYQRRLDRDAEWDRLTFVVTASRREMRITEEAQRHYEWQFVGFREIP